MVWYNNLFANNPGHLNRPAKSTVPYHNIQANDPDQQWLASPLQRNTIIFAKDEEDDEVQQSFHK